MDEEQRQQLLSKDELTIREVVQVWGVTYGTVQNYIERGLLEGRNVAPPAVMRGRWRVKTASLKKLLGINNSEVVPA